MFLSNKIILLVLTLSASSILYGQSTRVVFNQSVDKRYAWLGNDAEVVNFETEITSIINSASTSIEVSTMTFSKIEIANALIAKGNSGIPIRVIGNAGHRLTQDGWKLALRGANIDLIDNNLPAMVHRINFQAEAGSPPAGWLADRGETFGDHGAGVNYGWTVSQVANMRNASVYNSSLLDDCYSRSNADGTQTWEIEVPNGPYYVALMTGRPDAATRTYLQIENQNILNSGAFAFAAKPAGQYWGEAVDGGSEFAPGEDPVPNAVRINVVDGRLTVTIGNNTAPGGTISALCFLEIYRGDNEPNGDTSFDDGIDNTIQDRQTMHSKFILVDAGTPNQKIWISSGNLTQGMDASSGLSEDAIISTDDGLISTYKNMFDQMWGATSGAPNPVNSNFGTYKSATSTNLTIDGFPWQLRYSPSVSTTDMSDVCNGFINASTNDLTLIMEQFKSNGGIRGFDGTNQLVTTINSKLSTSYKMRALIGALDGVTGASFTAAHSQVRLPADGFMRIHNKYAITDAVRDSRTTLNGNVLIGSMNWTQSALHFNDEQTMIIQDPYIANKYLQHAMRRLDERSIAPAFATDIVVVLDRSLSMNDPSATAGISKLEASKQAANLFLDIINTDASHRVGMVRFGNVNEPFIPAITLSNYTNAQRSACHTGVNATFATAPIGNATCYNAALTEIINQMDGVAPKEKRLVHFFTDGKENCAVQSNTFYSALQDKSIEVHCTGFGDGTDMAASLEGLANATGGTYAQVELDPLSLNKRFAEVARNAMNLSTVLDPAYNLKPRESITTTFFIDNSATTIKIIGSWGLNLKSPYKNFHLIAPNGKKVNGLTRGVQYLKGSGYTVISINKNLPYNMQGIWTIIFTRSDESSNQLMPLDLIVYANDALFFNAECIQQKDDKSLQLALCRLLRKNEPVLDLKVTAQITMPIVKEYDRSKTETLQLMDDGANGDITKNDGLYSLLIPTKENGNYKIHFVATGIVKIEGKNQSIRREYTTYINNLKKRE